jgi:hypothetical protein
VSHKRVKVPVVLIFALVQGMWMGAQLHALTGAHARPMQAVSGCCGKTSSEAKIAASASCVVCATGALMQDTPAPAVLLSPPVIVPPSAVPTLCEVCLPLALPLHPGRGPPSVA